MMFSLSDVQILNMRIYFFLTHNDVKDLIYFTVTCSLKYVYAVFMLELNIILFGGSFY